VLVVSDHGEEFQDHGGFGHGTVMWNELLHVPLVVKLDRRDGDPPGGRRISERVRVMDVPQTLLQRAGVAAPPSEFMGFDLAPAFTADGEIPELPVIAEEFPDRKCLIANDLKWTWYGPKCRKQRTWLFNLADDPLELHDLSEERPEVVRRMREELERLYADWEARGFKHHQMVQERLGAADLEALGQLGYIDAGGDDEDDGESAPAPADRDAKREQRREQKREGKRGGDDK
jgi:arylsulfatase A-like enzyme